MQKKERARPFKRSPGYGARVEARGTRQGPGARRRGTDLEVAVQLLRRPRNARVDLAQHDQPPVEQRVEGRVRVVRVAQEVPGEAAEPLLQLLLLHAEEHVRLRRRVAAVVPALGLGRVGDGRVQEPPQLPVLLLQAPLQRARQLQHQTEPVAVEDPTGVEGGPLAVVQPAAGVPAVPQSIHRGRYPEGAQRLFTEASGRMGRRWHCVARDTQDGRKATLQPTRQGGSGAGAANCARVVPSPGPRRAQIDGLKLPKAWEIVRNAIYGSACLHHLILGVTTPLPLAHSIEKSTWCILITNSTFPHPMRLHQSHQASRLLIMSCCTCALRAGHKTLCVYINVPQSKRKQTL